MRLEFRKLRADEIDCRISTCNQYGVGLLLYKDARCDMTILDETVGPMNWQRHHTRDNANCIVAIYDDIKDQWVEKEDTGTESYTEKEKGLASDSFKRACFNWGIGRELYTAPDMWVKSGRLKTLEKSDKGKWTCRDYFSVKRVEYDNNRICLVEVANEKTGEIIPFGTPATASAEVREKRAEMITDREVLILDEMLSQNQKDWCYRNYHIEKLADMTAGMYVDLMNRLKAQDGNKG